MAKTKEPKTSSKKSEVKSLSSVKNASVTKPSQTPIAKSKQIAKEAAAKVNGHSKKPVKKAATPSSSDDDSDDSASASESESESESEVEVPKTVANGKVNGKTNGKVANDSSSEESDSDESDSSDDSSDADSSGDEKVVVPVVAKEDNDDSESSDEEEEDSDEESEEEAPAVKISKAAGPKKTNGAAKVVKAESDDDDSSNSSASSDDDEDEEEDSDDSDDSSEDEEEAPSKKRKAEEETVAPAKKSKVETAVTSGPTNLFVGNLSWNVDDEWLYREFEEFGEISGARVISDKATGRSKGFGYVDFTNPTNCAAALKAKKGAMIDGREANVDFSTPRDNNAPKERANDRAKQFGDSQNPPSDTLFLGNLSFNADENMIGEAFGEHGTVVNVRLPTDQETGNPKGFGYVTFGSVEECKSAHAAMLGAEIDGRPVRLDFATPRPDRSEGGGRGGRGGGRGGRGGFDRGGRGGGRGGFASRGGGRGGARGGRGGSTNRGGFGDFQGKKQTFA